MQLLTPGKLGHLVLRNRVVMAPMTRNRADAAGVVGDPTVTYYRQRASAGLIITEATNISEAAKGYMMTPGIWSEAQVEGWKRVTSAVHKEGGTIVMQLWHTGRVGHSEVRGGALPLAPSAVGIEGQMHFTPTGPKAYEVPRAMTTEEVEATIEDYATAAANAKRAGFDGVELHAAFGYLPHAFLVDSANQRTDRFGGSVENRARFVLEVMERLVAVWGAGRAAIRLSPTIAYNGMVDSDPLATFSYLIEKLNALPLAYLHLMRATPDATRFPHWPQDTVAAFGPLFHGPLILNGGFDREGAEAAVTAGAAGVSFGAPFVANPDLVARLAADAALAKPNPATYYGGGDTGYIDYPVLTEAPAAAPGYWQVTARVTDPAGFGRYTAVAGPVLASFGGQPIARGDRFEALEGSAAGRPYLVRFPSYAAARACFYSAGYQEAIALRAETASFDIVVVEGMPA